jgi:hypothetical protein
MVEAADVTSINAAWPTAPAVQTIDALSVTNGARGIAGDRIDSQSFRVSEDMTVGSIYISANNYGNSPFLISFFQTSDSNGNPLEFGSQVGSTITVNPFGTTGSAPGNLLIKLTEAEQFDLSAAASPAGYIMSVQLADITPLRRSTGSTPTPAATTSRSAATCATTAIRPTRATSAWRWCKCPSRPAPRCCSPAPPGF